MRHAICSLFLTSVIYSRGVRPVTPVHVGDSQTKVMKLYTILFISDGSVHIVYTLAWTQWWLHREAPPVCLFLGSLHQLHWVHNHNLSRLIQWLVFVQLIRAFESLSNVRIHRDRSADLVPPFWNWLSPGGFVLTWICRTNPFYSLSVGLLLTQQCSRYIAIAWYRGISAVALGCIHRTSHCEKGRWRLVTASSLYRLHGRSSPRTSVSFRKGLQPRCHVLVCRHSVPMPGCFVICHTTIHFLESY